MKIMPVIMCGAALVGFASPASAFFDHHTFWQHIWQLPCCHYIEDVPSTWNLETITALNESYPRHYTVQTKDKSQICKFDLVKQRVLFGLLESEFADIDNWTCTSAK